MKEYKHIFMEDKLKDHDIIFLMSKKHQLPSGIIPVTNVKMEEKLKYYDMVFLMSKQW